MLLQEAVLCHPLQQGKWRGDIATFKALIHLVHTASKPPCTVVDRCSSQNWSQKSDKWLWRLYPVKHNVIHSIIKTILYLFYYRYSKNILIYEVWWKLLSILLNWMKMVKSYEPDLIALFSKWVQSLKLGCYNILQVLQIFLFVV